MSENASLPSPLLHAGAYDATPSRTHRALVAGVVGAHLLGGWGLLQMESVRRSVGEVAPLMVDLIAPAAPPAPPPAPSLPPPPQPPPLAKPPPLPLPTITVALSPSPAPLVSAAPLAEPPAPVVAEAPPPAPPPPPPPPRTIPATAVQYLDPPAPVYPVSARRLNESGRVLVRVEIDTHGRARQVQLMSSSGSPRLDEAAMASVRAARFKPYTENGDPLVVWTTVPIVFELQS